MSTFLYDIQAIVRDYLKTDEYFADIHTAVDDAVDLDAEINKALTENYRTGETKGICIAIQTLSGGCENPNIPGIHIMPASLVFDVYENVAVNRAAGGNGKKGLVVAETLMAVMSRFDNSEIPSSKCWHAANAIDRVDLPEWGCVVHRCTMHTQGGTEDDTTVVATPAIAQAAGITITCATAGASIYYTTNGTRPLFLGASHGLNNGTLYSAPFATPAAGTVIKARAIKTALRSSLIASHTVT